MNARAIRENTIAYQAKTAPLFEGIRKIREDRDLTAEARETRIASLRNTAAESHEKFAITQRGHVDATAKNLAAKDARALLRKAARKEPERAVALAILAEKSSDAELLAHVRDVAAEQERDLVFAYAISTLAAERLHRIPAEERAELHSTLRAIGTTPEAQRAQSEYVVARAELARFLSLRDPNDNIGALTRAREAVTVDFGDGLRTLSDAEVRAHYVALRMDPDFAVKMPDEGTEPPVPFAEPVLLDNAA